MASARALRVGLLGQDCCAWALRCEMNHMVAETLVGKSRADVVREHPDLCYCLAVDCKEDP